MIVAWVSWNIEVSVSSRTSRVGVSPVSSTTLSISPMNSGRWTWSGDRLTLTKKSGSRSPAASQAATWRAASASTQRPSVRITPFSSARAMKSSGPIRPRVGWRQRTSASTAAIAAGRQLDDRLVVDHQLAVADAPGKLRRERVAGDDRRVHRRVEDRDAALAAGLRRVHRDVGVAEQLVGVLVRVAPDGDADRAADDEVLAGDRERHLERLDDPARDGVRPAQPVLVRQQQRELVAAQPRREVVAPDAALDPLRDRGQQPVARRVAERVVDDLEVVEVEEQHRQHAARPDRSASWRSTCSANIARFASPVSGSW